MKAVGNNESVLDMGRSLYKLHFQLLLLLESANKMFTALCSTAQDNQVTAFNHSLRIINMYKIIVI